MRQGGSERMSDDAVEEMLDKVVRLLAYISDKARSAASLTVHRNRAAARKVA